MPNKATITAKQGIAGAVTARVILNITDIRFDLVRQMLFVMSSTDMPGVWQEFDISANNTSTLTFSSPNYTLTIS